MKVREVHSPVTSFVDDNMAPRLATSLSVDHSTVVTRVGVRLPVPTSRPRVQYARFKYFSSAQRLQEGRDHTPVPTQATPSTRVRFLLVYFFS